MALSARTQKVLKIALADYGDKASLELISYLENLDPEVNPQLSGNYSKGIVVEETATLLADTVVNGSMLVTGNLRNPNGYHLQVNGDLIVLGALIFTTEQDDIYQGNLIVKGDCFLGEEVVTTVINYSQIATVTAYHPGLGRITVSPNLNTSAGFPLEDYLNIKFTGGPLDDITINDAYLESPGTQIYVDPAFFPDNSLPDPSPGDTLLATKTVTETSYVASEFKVNGVEGDDNLPTFIVDGDLFINGENTAFSGSGKDRSNALTMIIGGNLKGAQIRLNGGDATVDRVGGNGGTLTLGGSINTGLLESKGGNSDFPSISAGTGGNITVNGNCLGNINLSGGFGSSDGGSGNTAGSITIRGNYSNGSITADGGGCTSTVDPNAGAGSGGSVTILGNVDGDISVNGGNRTGTTSGYENGVNTPSAGSILINGNVTCFSLSANGGNSEMLPEVNSHGGSGGNISIRGNALASAGFVAVGGRCRGHNSIGFSAGGGGTISVLGICQMSQGSSVTGGNLIDGGNVDQQAGDGGSMNFFSIHDSSDNPSISANGGTCGGVGGRGGDGGTVNFTGPATTIKFMSLNGGNGGSVRAGNGGNVNAYGTFHSLNVLEADGGLSPGLSATGGNGGIFTFYNYAVIERHVNNSAIFARGGGGGAVRGAGGTISFLAGCVTKGVLNIQEGSGPATTVESGFRLAGNCSMNYMILSNTAQSEVRGFVHAPATLKVGVFGNKTVLTSADGATDTADITSMLADSIFVYDNTTGRWYRHQGTIL